MKGYWTDKKRPDLIHTNASKTMFQKGIIPWNKIGLTKQCANCFIEFHIKPSRSATKFCSRLCCDQYKSKTRPNQGIKDKLCPDCNRLILRRSRYCKSCSQRGERSTLFKGEQITYSALHKLLNKWIGKALKCSKDINHKPPYYWANISGNYNRDITDWQQLCAHCNASDGVKVHERFHKELGIYGK